METRDRSAALFGNEKLVEVVLTLDVKAPVHAQEIAADLGVANPMIAAVLKRLASARVVETIPRTAKRGALYYQPVNGRASWEALVHLCQVIDEEDV